MIEGDRAKMAVGRDFKCKLRAGGGLKSQLPPRCTMTDLLKLLWQEQTGQDLTEYALLLALLALGAITSIGTLAHMINNIFANAASNIGTAAGP
jgi:Flp pilus assembly pilin Flp